MLRRAVCVGVLGLILPTMIQIKYEEESMWTYGELWG
jgi:hypothetical protein